MADKGGVLGIYLMPFLGGAPGPRQASTGDAVIRHIEHALTVCGEDHVGIGSDMSVSPIEETPGYLQAERAFAAGRAKGGIAARGHASTVIEKVVGGNFQRAFRDISTVA